MNLVLSNFGLKDFEDNKNKYLKFFDISKLVFTKKNYCDNKLSEVFDSYNKEDIDKLIKEKFQNVNQKLFEILLYGFRFCAQSFNNNNLYGSVLSCKCLTTLKENYIPGNNNSEDLHLCNLLNIENHFDFYSLSRGCYVCSCGNYYTLNHCGFPMEYDEPMICSKCQKEIGYGKNDKLKFKQKYGLVQRQGHFRIFKDENNKKIEMKKYNITDEMVPNKTLKEFIENDIDSILNKESSGLNIISKELFMLTNNKIRKLRK